MLLLSVRQSFSTDHIEQSPKNKYDMSLFSLKCEIFCFTPIVFFALSLYIIYSKVTWYQINPWIRLCIDNFTIIFGISYYLFMVILITLSYRIPICLLFVSDIYEQLKFNLYQDDAVTGMSCLPWLNHWLLATGRHCHYKYIFMFISTTKIIKYLWN